MDGWITIGTKLDNKQLDKDLKDAQRRLQQFERENEKLATAKSKVQVDLQAYEKQKQAIQESTNEMLKLAQTEEQVNNVLSMEEIELNNLNQKYSDQFQKVEEINQKLQENAHNQGLVKNEVQKTVEELNKAKGFEQINKNLDRMSTKISNITKKVGHWALAVFGVRSAYMLIRQSMSTLAQYNEDMANKLSNIRLVLATALEPIINRILSLVTTLLSYLNYLTVAWFGLNIFARASELSTQKMADNLASGASSAKEIRKQLAGFDEMNILGDNVASSGGGGGTSNIPKFDLEQTAVPDWLKWIADNGNLVRLLLEGIATALLMIKWNLGLIQGLGLFLVIDGVVSLIKDIKTYLEDKTWENFKNILEDISEILLGLGLIGLANGLDSVSGKLGLISIVLSQIVNIASGIPDWVQSIINFLQDPTWDNYVRTIRSGADASGLAGKMLNFVFDQLGILQPQIKTTEEAIKDLKTAQDELTTAQDLYIDSIDRAEDAQIRLREILEKNQISNEQLNEIVRKGDEDYKNLNITEKEVYKAYKNNEKAQKNVEDSTKKLNEAKKKETKASIENELATLKETKQYDKYRDTVVKAMEDGSISADEARDLIGRSFSTMSEDAKKTFMQDLPDSIKNGLDPNKYESFGSKLKRWFSNLWSGLWSGVSGTISVSGGSSGGGGGSFAKGGIVYSKMPRLASGGVINMPGKGVPVGSAIAGERGQEAVLPLTDSQQMALLGEAIGKYININATVPVYIGNRQVAREIRKIEAEDNFAYNG